MLTRLKRWLRSPPPAARAAAVRTPSLPRQASKGLPVSAAVGVPAPDQPRTLVLYKFDTCPYCVRVFRAIDALGVAVVREDVRTDPAARRALQQATGRTTVPCLFIDGEPLFESRDIVAWLEVYAGATGTQASS